MKILVVHNRYRTYSGEDVVVEQETEMLRSRGHTVDHFTRDNREIGDGPLGLARAAVETVWSRTAKGELRETLRAGGYDVVHCHNTFPRISPAAYFACRAEGVPVVQSLQNYRLGCPAYALHRDGGVCEDCVGRGIAWPGILHGCYRDSRAASATVAAMQATHRLLGTWTDRVDRYIAMTEFARAKFVEIGLPAEKIAIKPNFVAPDPGPGPHDDDYAIFVGRLVPEKGLPTLIRAWNRLETEIPLKIVGVGPLEDMASDAPAPVEWLGRQPRERVMRLLKRARLFVFPSEWYEGFPLALLDALATGTPAIAGRLGAMLDMVEHGRTGLHFSPGDADDLAAAVDWAVAHPEETRTMGRQARADFERRFTEQRNYERLIRIYREAEAAAAPAAARDGGAAA